MWTRTELKTRAKEVLRKNYWKAFLVSIILAIAGANGGGRSPDFNWESEKYNWNIDTWNEEMYYVVIGIVIIAVIVFIIASSFRIFLGFPLEVGGRRFFVRSAKDDIDMNNVGYSFNKGKYMGVVKTMFLKGLYIFFWFFLLIIPAIIKSYAYRMVPYILAENPNIGANRAIELSNQMTKGHKFDMFVLDLSFIGWYLLGILAFFIGILFVYPYENATKAELYLVLRNNALRNNMCSENELTYKPMLKANNYDL